MAEQLAFHPYAEIFPLLPGAELQRLAEDIEANGLNEPVVLFDGQIVDGRNRYLALARIDPNVCPEGDPELFRVYEGDPHELLAWVVSKNLHRRHLTDDQRRMVAARIANLERGRPSENFADCEISRERAAEMLSTDLAGVDRARSVVAHAHSEIQAAVETGGLSVAAAAEVAKLAPEAQAEVVAKIERDETGRLTPESKRAVRAAAKELRGETQDEKRSRREARERELGERQRALPERRYGVILADPEWRFEPRSRETGMDRAADNHYPTSPTLDIVTRPVGSIAAEACVLLLWATAPMLPQALAVMAGWGFAYVSHAIWVKDRLGTGYWFRNGHELLLVGTRGDVVPPAMGEQWPSVIEAPVREHSAKPNFAHVIAEQLWPNLPKIELNAREARPGWDAWGLEAPEAEDGGGGRTTEDGGRTTDCLLSPQASVLSPQAAGGAGHADEPAAMDRHGSPAPAPPEDELDLPAYLRRGPDNALPAKKGGLAGALDGLIKRFGASGT